MVWFPNRVNQYILFEIRTNPSIESPKELVLGNLQRVIGKHNKINMAVRVEGETVIASFGSNKPIKIKGEEESEALPEHLVSFHQDKCVEMEVRAGDEEIIVSFCRGKRINLEGADESTALPEHLVEKIVSRVSFPSLFKFRGLSKAWLARFSSISPRARQHLGISFQKQVREFSNSWDMFYPICIGKETSFAYSRVSHVWQRLPGLSFLPNSSRDTTHLQIEGKGAILFLSYNKDELYIANILTRSWKRLPPCPERGPSDAVYHKLVSDTSLGTLILFFGEFYGEDATDSLRNCDYCWANVYDCKSNVWSVKRFVASWEDSLVYNHVCGKPQDPQGEQHAFLDGVLYVLKWPWSGDTVYLLAIDVEGETLKVLELDYPRFAEEIYNNPIMYLVVCNSNLHFVVLSSADPLSSAERDHTNDEVIVLKFDLESLRLLELAEGPPADLNVGKIYAPPVSDGNCITFREKGKRDRLLEYDPLADEWSLLTGPPLGSSTWDNLWLLSSFNPGLNPFGDV